MHKSRAHKLKVHMHEESNQSVSAASPMLPLQEKEYQILSDVPGATDSLDPSHITAAGIQQPQVMLSNTEVSEEVVRASIVYSQDLAAGLMYFNALAHFGAPEVHQVSHLF